MAFVSPATLGFWRQAAAVRKQDGQPRRPWKSDSLLERGVHFLDLLHGLLFRAHLGLGLELLAVGVGKADDDGQDRRGDAADADVRQARGVGREVEGLLQPGDEVAADEGTKREGDGGILDGGNTTAP